MQEKDIINATDGRYLENLRDIKINLETRKIRSIVLPNRGGSGFLRRKEPIIIIEWRQIKRIGVDVILIESFDQQAPTTYLLEESYE